MRQVARHAGSTAPTATASTWPLGRGFEKFYGTIAGAGSFYDPATLCRQDTFITAANDPEYRPESYYYTDALSDNAVRLPPPAPGRVARERRSSSTSPTPRPTGRCSAPEAAIARYRGKFDSGYAPVREARLAPDEGDRPGPARHGLSPGAEDWAGVPDKAWEARCKEVYAAMVETMDAGIGRIVAQLKADGPARQHPDPLPPGQRRPAPRTTGRSPNKPDPGNLKPMGPDQLQPADPAADADPRRPMGPDRPRRHARPGRHLRRLRPGLGERQQHPVPRVQALDPRGRDLDPPDRPLARRASGPTAPGSWSVSPAT